MIIKASPSNNKTGSGNNSGSIRTPLACSLYTPVRRAHDLMREEGISPMKKPTIWKCLALAEIQIKDAATTARTKQSITEQRNKQNIQGKYAKAEAVNMYAI